MTSLSVTLNALVGIAYLAIATLISRGLVQTGQVRTNGLAVATAAIFFSCSGGHFLHAVHLAAAGSAGAALVDWHMIVWDAGTVVIALTFLALRRQYGALTGSPRMFDDHTQRARELRLRQQAYRDDVTGLPNRAAFTGELEQRLRRTPHDRPALALLLLDFDGFKHINDSLGHAAGDDLLRRAAERLRHVMRPGDFIARLGGDEFTMILPELHDPRDAGRAAERILAVLRKPFELGPHGVHVTASIGIAFRDESHESSFDEGTELLRQADIAMYRAKRDGKDRYAAFRESMSQEVEDELTLANELRVALDSGGIGVEYQPVVEMDGGEVIGFEALARWYEGGEPRCTERLIAVAEDSGLIVPLGYLVLQRACRQLASLKEEHGAGAMPWVSVNLSSRQIEDTTLPEYIEGLLDRADVPPDRLLVEVTERVAVSDDDALSETLRGLRLLGVRIAIDDFGTGFSSLGAIARLNADVLKIDRSFVAGLSNGDATTAVVRTVLELGRVLDLEVIAEGIESGVQARGLRHMGCRLGQGFYFGRPAAPDVARRFANAAVLAPAELASPITPAA